MNHSKTIAIGIILTLGLVLIVGCIGPFAEDESDEDTVVLSSSIKGCAETANGTSPLVRESRGDPIINPKNETEPEIKVVEDKIIYSRATTHLCCRKIEIDKEMTNSLINIFEYWTGQGCRCICFTEIQSTLENVSPGTYTVEVYKKGVEPYGEGEKMEEELLITEKVTVE